MNACDHRECPTWRCERLRDAVIDAARAWVEYQNAREHNALVDAVHALDGGDQ